MSGSPNEGTAVRDAHCPTAEPARWPSSSPCTTSRRTSSACIESVFVQSHASVELVVVDDGSTDGSWEVVESATAGSGATLVRLSNGGVSRARNLGFEACRTRPDYVVFLDGDDVLLPDALQHDGRAHGSERRRQPCATACRSSSTTPAPSSASTRTRCGGPGRDWGAGGCRTRRSRRRSRRSGRTSGRCPRRASFARTSYERTQGWDPSLCRPARPFQAEDKDMAIQLALTRTRPPPAVADARVSGAADGPSSGPVRGPAGGGPEVVERAAAGRGSAQGQAGDPIRFLRRHARCGHRPSRGGALRIGTRRRQRRPDD